MLTIDIQIDTKAAILKLTGAKEQVRFASVVALTRTAGRCKDLLTRELASVFDRPTPYTLNSLYIRPATKSKPEAKIWLKDDTSKGTPAARYLLAEIEGGNRRIKRFERALQYAGILPSGMQVVPGGACPTDQFGNIPASFIVRMLSYLQAFGETGYKANMTDAKRKRMAKDTKKKRGVEYFALRQKKGRLLPGVYERTRFSWGSAVRPVFIFVRAGVYQRRFDFYGIVKRNAPRIFREEFQIALNEALAKGWKR